MMMNKKKELKMMETKAMRCVNAGGLAFIGPILPSFYPIKFAFWLAKRLRG